MPAPCRLTAAELRALSITLETLSRLTRETGVRLGAYDSVTVETPTSETVVRINWDAATETYVVDDQIGY